MLVRIGAAQLIVWSFNTATWEILSAATFFKHTTASFAWYWTVHRFGYCRFGDGLHTHGLLVHTQEDFGLCS